MDNENSVLRSTLATTNFELATESVQSKPAFFHDAGTQLFATVAVVLFDSMIWIMCSHSQ